VELTHRSQGPVQLIRVEPDLMLPAGFPEDLAMSWLKACPVDFMDRSAKAVDFVPARCQSMRCSMRCSVKAQVDPR